MINSKMTDSELRKEVKAHTKIFNKLPDNDPTKKRFMRLSKKLIWQLDKIKELKKEHAKLVIKRAKLEKRELKTT